MTTHSPLPYFDYIYSLVIELDKLYLNSIILIEDDIQGTSLVRFSKGACTYYTINFGPILDPPPCVINIIMALDPPPPLK